jgi:hypothetical protein
MVYICDKNTKLTELFNVSSFDFIFKLRDIPPNLKKLKIDDKHIEYYRNKYVSELTKLTIEEFIRIKQPSYFDNLFGIFNAFPLIIDNDKNKFIIKFLDSNEKGQRFSLRKFKSKIY